MFVFFTNNLLIEGGIYYFEANFWLSILSHCEILDLLVLFLLVRTAEQKQEFIFA